jgi:hypothetical protein
MQIHRYRVCTAVPNTYGIFGVVANETRTYKTITMTLNVTIKVRYQDWGSKYRYGIVF